MESCHGPGHGRRVLIPRTHDVGGFAVRRALPTRDRRMVGPRHVFWDFVSSRPERIEQAKADWKAGRFAKVAGDGEAFIPLSEARVRAARDSARA